MIVPKNLGYAGIAGIPVENGLYAAAAAAIIYGLFCTSRHISTGPSSSLAAVAGGAVLLTGLGGNDAAQLVAAIAVLTGALFLLVAALKLGWLASFLSLAVVTGFLAGAAIDVVIGELPKLTGTSADGVNAWQELASWVRGLGDLSLATLVVGRALPSPSSSGFGSRFRGSRGARPRRRRPDQLGRPRPGRAGRRAGGPCAARPAASAGAIDRCRVAESPDDRDLGLRAPAHRVLPDRGRCPGIRDEASVSRRPQPGVGCPGNGEHRRRLLPGHARVDEPVGELAERSRRGQDAGRLARDRWDRRRDADPARAALLRAAQGRPGRDHHRRGRLRDDRRRRVPSAAAGEAVRLLDRAGGGHRRPVGGRAPRRGRRHRPVAAVAHQRHDPTVDAAAGPRDRARTCTAISRSTPTTRPTRASR